MSDSRQYSHSYTCRKKIESFKLLYGSTRARSALPAHVHYVRAQVNFKNLFAIYSHSFIFDTQTCTNSDSSSSTPQTSHIHASIATHTRMNEENLCLKKWHRETDFMHDQRRRQQRLCVISISCVGEICGMPVSAAFLRENTMSRVVYCLLSVLCANGTPVARISNRLNLSIFMERIHYLLASYLMLTQRVVYGN